MCIICMFHSPSSRVRIPLFSSSSASPLPPPSLLLTLSRCLRCCSLRVVGAAQRGHGGLSRRDGQGLHGAGDPTAGPVRLQPGQDPRQRPVAAVQDVRLCRYLGGALNHSDGAARGSARRSGEPPASLCTARVRITQCTKMLSCSLSLQPPRCMWVTLRTMRSRSEGISS